MERRVAMDINSEDRVDAADSVVAAGAQFDIHHLTEQQLAMLGVSQVAYVKPVMLNGTPGFAIHAADGTPMAVVGDRDVAMAAIVQNEMHPLSVH
jgi:hypothetical protein